LRDLVAVDVLAFVVASSFTAVARGEV